MSKRLKASLMMFNKKRALRYPVNVVAAASGTGTVAKDGIITYDSSGDLCYLTVTSGTNIATVVST